MGTRRLAGKWAALALLAVGVLAAVGTCSKFSADNPLSTEVRADGAGLFLARFPSASAARIEPGMSATLSAEGVRVPWKGRVVSVSTQAGTTEIRASFPGFVETRADPRASAWKLSVDTSGNPEPDGL